MSQNPFLNLVASDGLKLQGITPPGITICQKLADSENICVWPYEKGPPSIYYMLSNFSELLEWVSLFKNNL